MPKGKTVTVVAREIFPYADVIRRPGDTFEAPAEDARVLLLVGRVVRPSALPARVTPEAPVEPRGEDAPDDPQPLVGRRGRSQRKDLVPEP